MTGMTKQQRRQGCPPADDREERIRRKAYDIWLGEGRPGWQHERHWTMAKEMVAAEDRERFATGPDSSHRDRAARQGSKLPSKLENPARHYDAPHEVVRDASLSPSDKKKALDSWEEDSQALQRAEDEGMGGGEPAKLSETLAAKKTIGAKSAGSVHVRGVISGAH